MNPSSIQGALSRFNTMSGDEWEYRDDLTGLAEMMVSSEDDAGPGADNTGGRLDDLRLWLNDTAARESPGGSDPSGLVSTYLDEVVAGQVTAARPDSRQLADELEIRKQVLDGMAGLPANYRLALVLKDGANLTVEQIGEHLGTSEASVRSVLYRARRSLRERLRS